MVCSIHSPRRKTGWARTLGSAPSDGKGGQPADVGEGFQREDRGRKRIAPVTPDHLFAQSTELHADFFLSHRVPGVTFGHIHTRAERLARCCRDCHSAGLELGEQALELLVGYDLDLVHDRDQRLIEHALFLELERRHHAVDKTDGQAIRERVVGGLLAVGAVLVRQPHADMSPTQSDRYWLL